MKTLRSLLILFMFSVSMAGKAFAGEQLICCGGEEVFVIAADGERSEIKDRVWRWQAKDSPEIPADLRTQFRTTDECKPYRDQLLITSSSGGVALVQRKDKHCVFFTSIKNAHSACLLPGERIAIASSTGGDELLVLSLEQSGTKLDPIAKMSLTGAHGAVWDAKRERLWALATADLLLVEIRDREGRTDLVVEKRWKLPKPGGHDLSPARDERYLYLTSHEAVYRFDTKEERFDVFEPLAHAVAIKSIDEHPTTGRIVYHQADHERNVWWSDTVRLLDPAQTIHLPGERLYKVRWDAVRE